MQKNGCVPLSNQYSVCRMEDHLELSPVSSVTAVRLEVPKISLHHAARDDRLEVVEQWIRLYEADTQQLNKKDPLGYAPLHYAAKFNRFKILVGLIEAGADPNTRTLEENFTPLHFAARYTPRIIDREVQLQETRADHAVEVGKLSTSGRVMQFLVNLRKERRVKINAKAQYGITPLHLACQRGNQAAVSVLLRSNDVIVSVTDDNKDTPLHEACLGGNENIVENLVTRMKLENPDTMDINPQNNEFQTPLHLACREGHIEVVKVLLKHIEDFQKRKALVDTRDKEQNTALHLACESGVEEIVRILLSCGADLFATKLDDVCPIHIAAHYGFTGVADVLMESGEDLVNNVEIYNQTPLHYAATHNQVDMINFLIDRQADVTAKDTQSYTPLMLAAVDGHMDAFNVLLEKGSAIDETDEDGKTVVHLAAEENHVEILRVVMGNKEGLKLVTSTDASYNTPLHLAAKEGNDEAVAELLKSHSKTNIKIDAKNELNKTPIHLAASKGHVQVMESLLTHQKDSILDQDEDGNTPLHLAALNGFQACVKLLLNANADFDARNANLWTPMDCAANSGHDNIILVLIEAGADVNPTDKLNITPLHLASQEGHLNAVKVLLDNDAAVDKVTGNNFNSLDVAIDYGHEDIALAIIKSKHWRSALRNTSINPLGVVTTPLRKLIKKMPEVAEEVFNRCSVGNETKDGKIRLDSKEYQLTFNYEFLEDFQDEKENICSRFFKKMCKGKVTADDASDSDTTSGNLLDGRSRHDEDLIFDRKPSQHSFVTTWGPVGFQKKLHPLSIMVEHDRTDLLQHPLVTSLLKLKWRRYGRNAYFSNLLFFMTFVVFLSTFALVSLNPQSETCVAVLNGQFGNSSDVTLNMCSGEMNDSQVCDDGDLRRLCSLSEAECGMCGLSVARRGFLFFAASYVIIVAVIRLLLEMFQLVNLKLSFLLDWVNWAEIILFVCSIIFVFVYGTDCLCPMEWQWQIGCIAVFLSWIDLIVIFRKIPLTGIYVLMFVHIFYTFCKMIILTMLLIIAFSLAFYMAFFDPSTEFVRSSFATPGRAIVKTMTMTTGEFEYDAIFRQFPGGAEDGSITDEIPFPPVSFLLWIIFLVLMPILLTNLLVGLAVDDIKGIQDAAVLRRLALQVELALSVEELLPIGLRRYFITEEYTVMPNRTLSFMENLRYKVFGSENSRFDSQENISRSLHPEPTPIEQVQNQTRKMALDMQKMRAAIVDIADRNLVMEKLIREMAKRQKIVPAGNQEELRSFI